MLYSPMLSQNQISSIKNQNDVEKFKKLAQTQKAIFYRAELDVQLSNETAERWSNDLRELGFRRAFEEMQPEHTLLLDITKSESEILDQMKPKGRYNIKVAERSNLDLAWSAKSGRELDGFYSLYQEMAKRQKISYRSKSYFDALLEILGQKGYARVYSACTNQASIGQGNEARIGNVEGLCNSSSLSEVLRADGRETPNDTGIVTDKRRTKSIPLAAAIVSYYNDRATYLFGGSNSDMRNLMAPYGLHWKIIQDARSLACIEYDFFGIAPDDNEKHPWAGITRFKKQFGGQEMQLAGSWDLVFRPVEYQLFKVAEKIRR